MKICQGLDLIINSPLMINIFELCKNASLKNHTLAKVAPDMNISKRRILMDVFSQFSYCPLLWMSCSQINKLIVFVTACLYPEYFWSSFSRIWTEYGEIIHIPLYSAQVRGNTDQKTSEYVHFPCSAWTLPTSSLSGKKVITWIAIK